MSKPNPALNLRGRQGPKGPQKNPFAGRLIRCEDCSAELFTRSNRRRRCDVCAKERGREVARQRVNRLSRERGAEKVGQTKKLCPHCGDSFVLTSPRQVFCAVCRKLDYETHLATDAQRKAAKEYRRLWGKALWRDPDKRKREHARQLEKRQKRKSEPAFLINERMSAGVRFSLAGEKKGSRWESLVGYTVDELIFHLERQFDKRMSWQNRGKWHIDHIVPLASFRFKGASDPEFKAAWALTNLRPLWGRENHRKNSRRLFLL